MSTRACVRRNASVINQGDHGMSDIRSNETSEAGLEVFSGVHRGAKIRLGDRPWHLVGAADDCDVVLRDAGVRAHHLLVSHEAGAWTLRALDAALHVDGRELAAGNSMAVADAVCCRIAGVSLTFGQDGSPAWARAVAEAKAQAEAEAALHEAPPAEAEPVAALDPSSDSSIAPSDAPDASPAPIEAAARQQPRRAWRRFAYAGGIGLVIAMTSAFGWVVHTQAPQGRDAKAGVERVIASLGLTEVKIEQGQNGHLSLQGTVANEASRSSLQRSLKEAGLEPTLDIVTGDRLALSVQDSFRQRGLPVDARYAGGGKVVVTGAAPSPQAEQVIRDVLAKTPSVVTIELGQAVAAAAPEKAGTAPAPIQNVAAVAAPAATAARDPKRVVAVVGGERPYLLTQDGARYLTGAMLPDGSLIESVDGHAVTFLRNGNHVQVDF
jgi:type III secretion system YscD/HrpQ family protein